MRHYIFTVLVMLLSLISASAQSNKQTNVIMLCVDDWNDMIHAFGDNQAITPNVDKLCSKGVRFTNCHAAGTYCLPSRTALMTGIAPWNSGCYSDQPHHYNMPERKTIPMLFQENGYATYGGGKVYHHMPGYVDLKGYDEYFHWNPEQKKRGWGLFAWNDNPATPANIPASDFGRTVRTNWDICPIPNEVEKDMADTKMIDWAIEVLKKDLNKPLFLSAGLYAPHKPNFAPQKYYDLYPADEIKLPETKDDDIEDLPPFVQNMVARKSRHAHQKIIRVDNGWKRAVQGYLAAISYADAQLGRFLDALEESRYAENTIVVFWSDNGYHLGEKECWAKHTLWERTTNVPMIWAGLGTAKNKKYKGVVSLLDIYPTLAAMCNLSGIDGYDGKDISKELINPDRIVDRAVLTSKKKGDCFSVFTKDWHYLNYRFGVAEELYDANNDQHEWTNLASTPEYSKVVKELRSNLPESPAPPAKGRESLELVCKGETFEWVERQVIGNKESNQN